MQRPLGHHLLLDLYGLGDRADRQDLLRQQLVAAARAGGATVVEERFHHFSPHGVSGVVILAESHLAIHTWPEHDFAAVDIFTCGGRALTEAIADEVVDRLRPRQVERRLLTRSLPAEAPSRGPARLVETG